MTASARARLRSGTVVAAIAVLAVAGPLVRPPWWVRGLTGAALLAGARLSGLGWTELGLGRDRLAAGCRWALGAVGVVGAVYLVGVLVPPTRPAFLDDRYDLPLPGVLAKVLLSIPLGTVVLEEVAFRSVLWAALARHCRPWPVLVTTAVAFGLWHVPTVLVAEGGDRGLPAGVVAGTVAVTTAGGLVFGGLRRRSGSVVAAAGAHWATNALGVLAGPLARRLDAAGGSPGLVLGG
ncbi:CPBP family intramembrane glutamic endopeptidase [Geodermatophilus sp. SYSU D00684]